MRVLFLNPPHKFKLSRDSRWPEFTKTETLYYPFWLSYAAGVAMEAGHDVLLIDAIARKWSFSETIRAIKNFSPELTVIETTTPSIISDMEFVGKLKKSIKTKIALVGTHVSALPEETLKKYKNVDFIARREFDYTVKELIEYLEKNKALSGVLGLSYRKGKRIFRNKDRPFIQNPDELPFVSEVYKKFLNVRDYRYALARHPMIQIWSSRGCPNYCTFCQLPQSFDGRIFRPRSPENFVEELEWIKNNMPEIKEVFIEDDTFTIDKARVLRICDLILEKGLKIIWSVNVRADLEYSLMKRMKEAGCRMLIVGYESGNQQLLNNVRKGITLVQAERFTEAAKMARLKIFGCFMIGLPGETKETVYRTLNFAKKLNPDMAFFQQAVPFPGTEFYEWCKKNRYLTAKNWDDWLDKNGQLDFIVSYPQLSNREMKELRDKIALEFVFSPRFIVQMVKNNLHPYEVLRLMNVVKSYGKYLIKRDVSKK